MNTPFGSHRKSGQTILFLSMALVVLSMAVLWMFDAHKILFVKAKARNGGDAAAMTAARWQGLSLNLMGELNVMQAVAIADALSRGQTEFPEAMAIAGLQARVNIAGPMLALAASQQAAKLNGIYTSEEFTSDLAGHARVVRNEYTEYYDSAYEALPPNGNSWEDYADMLEAVVAEGIAAYPDNADLIAQYANSNHLLLNPAFYEAISGANWCWFFHNAYDTLREYTNWRDWPPLPEITVQQPINSEFYSLKLMRVSIIDNVGVPGGRGNLLDRMSDSARQSLPPEILMIPATWYFYRPSAWVAWTSHIPDNFPWQGDIRPEANFYGADAAVRIHETTTRHTQASGADVITWSAAAKAFGGLPGANPPHHYGMVLPSFEQVALIPVDSSSAPQGSVRPGWLTFIYEYLPIYMEYGPYNLPPGNWYADQLRQWENADFRGGGIAWLSRNSAQCQITGGGGGGGGGGGTSRGH